MKKLVLSAAVILAALCACQKEIDQPAENVPAQVCLCTITVDASKTPVTKALDLQGTTINATWAEGETVAVYKENDAVTPIGRLTPSTYGTSSTKLTGTIDATGLSAGSKLVLIYPGNKVLSYDGQDGTFDTLSSSFDFASANVSVGLVADGNVAVSAATFYNVAAIVRFALLDTNGNRLFAKSLTISDDGGSLVNACLGLDEGWLESYGPVKVVSEDTTQDFFVALCLLGGEGPLCLTAEVGDDYYECIREKAYFEAGKYYSGSVKMNKVTYTVAGGPVSVFENAWDQTDESHDMELDKGLYRHTIRSVEKGTVVALKVVKNHAWIESLGGASYPEGDNNNIIVTAWEAGDLEVTFDPVTHEVKAWIDYYTEPGEIPTVYTIVGDQSAFGTNWYPADTANDMVDNGNGTWSKTYIGLEAGPIRFRVIKDRSWEGAVPDDQYDPYYYDVPSYGDITITFNPSAADTEKITVSFTERQVTYTIAGDPSSLFGSSWDVSNQNNDMIAVGDGTYTKSYTVSQAFETVEFKIVKEHSWNHYWPSGDSDNYKYYGITGPGTFTITFNPSTGEINASFEATSADVTYTVAGKYGSEESATDAVFGMAWDPSLSANDMVMQPDGTYRKVYDWVPVGSIEFKVVKDRDWSTCWPASNYEYSLPIGGTVTIDFNPESHEVSVNRESTCTVVGAPEAIFGVSDWCIDPVNDMTLQADGTYTKTFTGITANVNTQFKIAINHSWNESYGDTTTSSQNCEYTTVNTNDLVITFNPETKAITYCQD